MKKNAVFFDFAMPISVGIAEVPASPKASLIFQKHPMVIVVLEGNLLFNNIRNACLYPEQSVIALEGDVPAIVSSKSNGANATILTLSLNIDYYQKKYPSLSNALFKNSLPQEDHNFVCDILNIALIAITNGIKSYDTLQMQTDRLIEKLTTQHQFFSSVLNSKDSSSKRSTDYVSLINELLTYINGNYDQRPSLREFANTNHISPNYASHLLKQICNKSFQEMLSITRCMKSLEFLLDRGYRINELAYDVGFSFPTYYVKNFQALFGVSPQQYRDSFFEDNISALQIQDDMNMIEYQIKRTAKSHHYSLSAMSDTLFTSHRVDLETVQKPYEDLMSDTGRISNIKTPMAETAHKAFAEMQKVFRISVITIEINTSLKDSDTPTLLTISRNINYLLDLGFTVALETKDASPNTVGLIVRFLDFYAHVSPNNVVRIKVLYRSNNSAGSKLRVQKNIKERILSETGLKIDVIYASDYVDEINYLPAIYDSFVMAPFAVDELLNPKKWRKEIAFSLIDEVGFSGKFLSGGNGLLTWNGIKKPWWHAYMLLAKLRGNVVDQGEDYIITNENGRIAILTFNMCRLTPGFLESIHSTDELTAAILQNRHIRREHNFTLSNIFGTYKETRYSINQSSCLYTKWYNLGFSSYMTEDEEEILATTCQPKTDFRIFDASGLINVSTIEKSFGVSLVILEKTYTIDTPSVHL